jgi:DNA-binding NarL/FixJ family response regulator
LSPVMSEGVDSQPMDPAPAGGPPTGVVLVNALPGALAQMHDLLSTEADMEVLIHAESADDTLEAMRGLPHRLGVVVVVTLGLGGDHDSFWLMRSIRELYPTLPILACGTDTDDDTISWALFTGADGFVALEVEPAQFVDALRRIAHRELILESLSTGWMEREGDRGSPLIVLPEATVEGPGEGQSPRTGVLREEGGAGAEETEVPEEDEAAAAGTAPEGIGAELARLSGKPGSRVGRLRGRRRA